MMINPNKIFTFFDLEKVEKIENYFLPCFRFREWNCLVMGKKKEGKHHQPSTSVK